jgi:hypothetical protein
MSTNDNHRQLLQLVHEYVKLNLSLELKPTLDKTIEVRKVLSDIRRCASTRREEVMEVQRERRAYLDTLKGNSDLTEAQDQDD